MPAIRQLISEGININVTLLFAQEVYEKVAEAYIAGLEDLAKRGGNLKKMAGVASFFISRIDTLVDSLIEEKLKTTKDAQQQALLKSLLGQSCNCQWKADVSALPEDLQRGAVGGAGGQGGADPARAVGQHQHEESCVS